MGKYFNPGNENFQGIRHGKYVDKTGLIAEINNRIGTSDKLVCISRPRRFGKSYAAQVLCAYYDCTCDSHGLFDDCDIAGSGDYEDHINKYNVVCLDIAGLISELKKDHRSIRDITTHIQEALKADLLKTMPELAGIQDVSNCLMQLVEITGRKIVFVIDEWDAVIREATNDEAAQISYLNLLRAWFKNINFTGKVVATAYMTGILPIKKDGSQSAISDFREYPILYPDGFAQYTGFTESEVRDLCAEYQMDFQEFKSWYDGYEFPDCGSIYNPYSVMRALQDRKCRSYWQKTSASESLMTYINMDFDGLQEIITRLISGEEIEVNVDTFENDFETFRSRDDVLTLLTHLGYLTYEEDEKTVRIPNEEIRIEFRRILSGTDTNKKWAELIRRSQKLLEDTVSGSQEAVAKAIAAVRDTEYAPTFYNDEQALRYVVKFAYITAVDQYMKVEELPSGHGIADVAYLPKRRSRLPAMVIELKWNKTSEGAIGQIKDRNYPAILRDYGGDIILVGINYNEKTNAHTCTIERIHK